MSSEARSVYRYLSKVYGDYELTDNKELAFEHDPDAKLASILDLIEHYTDYGEVFNGFLNTYDGLAIWRTEEDESESGYELLQKKKRLAKMQAKKVG